MIYNKKLDKIKFRKPTHLDAYKIYDLVKKSKILDVNSSYCYGLIGLHHSNTSIVVCDEDKIIAFCSGYLIDPKTLFIWQICVDQNYLKQGIAKKMLNKILQNNCQIEFINLTISPSNQASQKLFGNLAKSLNAKITKKALFNEKSLGIGHEDEDLFIIGPLKN